MQINELLTILASNKMSKPSAPKQWGLFKSLLEHVSESDLANNPDVVTILAQLYQGYLPTMPKKPKTDIHWLAHSMSKKDVRYYLQYIYCDGNRTYSTDGHRLHVVNNNNNNLEVGFYDTALVKCDVDATFPDIDRVIPSENLSCIGLIEPDELIRHPFEVYVNRKAKPTHAYKFFDDDKVAFNGLYIQEAVSFMDEPTGYWDLTNKNSSLLIKDNKNPDRFAVVMPMRL